MPRDERTKADYQPWNHEHFMADRHVRRMHPHIRKSYVMLLHEAFFCSTRPYLPDDDNELWLLADCESIEEWVTQSAEVRDMFESFESDGQKLLVQRRVEEDWDRILNKRGVVSEARSKAAKARWNRLKQTDANECKTEQTMLSKEKLSTREVELSEETQIIDNEQGETEMKAERTIPISCMEILGERAETYSDVIEQIKSRARATSNGQVLREFEEWAVENQGDDFRGKPLSAWLRSYTSGRIEQRQATENPMVKAIGREIAYRSGNQMVLEPKHKAALVPIIEEDSYTFEEVLGAYSEFFQKMDKDNPKNIQYAANNFVAQAADLLYSVRRKATEKQAEQAAVAATAERMQLEAEQDRQKRLEAREREQELVEEELPD